MSHITTSQTIGPFSHEAWQWAADASAAGKLETTAATIVIEGTIYDGDGTPINDAQIEAWQPAAAGAEAAQALPGFRRVPSGERGEFSLRLSQCAAPSGGVPATFVTVFARGLVKHQFTAVFLEDDSGLAQSAILQQVPAGRRPTLIARKTAPGVYHWDIWMQSDKETAFFDYV
ncbi:protocatechuate 3,4-dioxygenase [Duganella sp. Dugasp56]|jgi:protocatechuate 3,4-dioxygenase alpha subunit|uniref:protocatechuate 3,4-dioxygenase n=1 Tax=unclassified Duganella TaxID=2636909 RepID=UPI003346241A